MEKIQEERGEKQACVRKREKIGQVGGGKLAARCAIGCNELPVPLRSYAEIHGKLACRSAKSDA